MKLNGIKNENKNENKNKKLIRKLKKQQLWLLWISVQVQEEKVLFGVFIVSCRELKEPL